MAIWPPAAMRASGAFVVSLYPAGAWAARVPVNNAWRAMNSRCPAAFHPRTAHSPRRRQSFQ